MIYEASQTPIPDELFLDELSRAILYHDFSVSRSNETFEWSTPESAAYYEASARVGFASMLASRLANTLPPDDVRSAMEPVIENCKAYVDYAFGLNIAVADETAAHYSLHPQNLSIWSHLLEHIILAKAMYSYPPENDAARSYRAELVESAYPRCGPALVEALRISTRRQANKALARDRRASAGGSVQETSTLALINRESDERYLALPGLAADDEMHKNDVVVLSYDPTGSIVRYAQTKTLARDEDDNRYPHQALLYLRDVGNGMFVASNPPQKRLMVQKTWTTARAIAAELSGCYTEEFPSSSETSAHLSAKRQEVLEIIEEEAVVFPHALWSTPRSAAERDRLEERDQPG
jgi:hypothetical protein